MANKVENTIIVDIRGAKYEKGLLEMDRHVAYRIALSILTMLALAESTSESILTQEDDDALPPRR